MILRPYPFRALVRRALIEHEREHAVFGLAKRRWYLGSPELDLSITLHGRRLATPFGPAAGPHAQLAQNIALSWLAGGRAIELKTVQVLDRLQIPRPCIDIRATGFNVEWSQELTLPQSIEEYVKASMLVQILGASGAVPADAGPADFAFDMSVGYDLDGIRSEAMTSFLAAMIDARATIHRLRGELVGELAPHRDLDFVSAISRSVTLSTFHRCPPQQIDAIVRHLQQHFGVDCTVKFNPTLLGADRVRRTLDDLGYRDIRVPDQAFADDLHWDEALALVERCGASAASLGCGFGVKFSNTLLVENTGDFLPASERHRYLSGRPLHLLAMELVRDFRAAFGGRYPVSFSGGIEQWNFADAVALGLKPVTACTDLLREGGYGRAARYLDALRKSMQTAAVSSIDELVAVTAHDAAAAPLSAAAVEAYIAKVRRRPELQCNWSKTPKKVRSDLRLFDCLACDKCLPVCPNHALFTFAPGAHVSGGRVQRRDGRWALAEGHERVLGRGHQIAVFADFCNECGNCDVFCPEHGGPYKTKPRFFGSREAFACAQEDGYWVSAAGATLTVHARLGGFEYELDEHETAVRFAGPGFEVTFDPRDPSETLHVEQDGSDEIIDMAPRGLMLALGRAVLDRARVNYVNILAGHS
ncbi:MAG: 4Fe-4S dicluster domain-containing protein [Bacteroidales bacterium]